jgi:hypothetical protein
MTGRWQEKKIGWLPQASDAQERNNSVLYIPLKCLNKKCQSKRVICYSTALPYRYHECKDCGHKFRSVEVG